MTATIRSLFWTHRVTLDEKNAILDLEAERDRLEDELRQERLRKWSTGGAMTTEEANALRQERDRYRAALKRIAERWEAVPSDIAREALEGEE